MNIKINIIGFLSVLVGVGALFIQHEYSWVISATLIGSGTGSFFWNEDNK